MASLEKRWWENPHDAVSLLKTDTVSGSYHAYIPDLLAGRTFVFGGETAAWISEAERQIGGLDRSAAAISHVESLARLLLRAESSASSFIEGLVIGNRRLLKEDAARSMGEAPLDVTAAEVLANIDAMTYALAQSGPDMPITLDLLLETHRSLLESRLGIDAGRLRERQGWIGGSRYNPLSSTFVPPPYKAVPDLMADLMAFCNEDSLSPVAQAAIAHAQFETIHPFVDGNGRVGRALVHMVLRRRGLAERVLTPISLVLATWAGDYVAGLNGTHYVGSADSAEARKGVDAWIDLFAKAGIRAVSDAMDFEQRIVAIREDWDGRLGLIREGSAVEAILDALPGVPIMTVQTASDLIGRSFNRTNEAIAKIVEAGILKQTRVSKRARAFEAPDVMTAFVGLERQLASRTGNTYAEPPSRPVPERTWEIER